MTQEGEYERLVKLVESLESRIHEHEVKEEELYQQIQSLLEEVKGKDSLVKEFEELIKIK